MSTGLIYTPCLYADKKELVKLCIEVARHSGVFVVHMRNEGDHLLESIDEMLEIARESKVYVHISHFKASGVRNWGKSSEALKKLEVAKSEGLEVSYDQYPYTAGSTFLSSLLPSWLHEGGVDKLLERLRTLDIREKIKEEYMELMESDRTTGWDNVLVTYVESKNNKRYEGLFMAEIAEKREQEPIETLMDIVLEENNMASMASFTMSEEDLERILSHPLGMTCTDGLLLGKPHPRAYGAFPRVLGHYVREKKVQRLEEAVRRMTSYPARVFKLGKRGLILPGYIADLVVFNPKEVLDRSTYEKPRQYPDGIKHVLVSGVISVKNGKYTGQRKGKVIKKEYRHDKD
jgi:N-acyl-D-amino-acid deacylase